MTNTITYYQLSSKMIMHKSCGKKDDIIETVSDLQEKIGQLGNKCEKQDVTENRAKQMYQIWGDNFVSDSLH